MILKFEVICIPTKCGLRDSDGKYFCRWGSSGKKYYYTPGDDASKEAARKKANEQGQAAHAGGYEGSEKSIDILEEEKEDEKKPKVPNPDEPDDEAEPGEEEEWKKSIDTPTKMEDIKEGSFIIHKGKIGKILKILE